MHMGTKPDNVLHELKMPALFGDPNVQAPTEILIDHISARVLPLVAYRGGAYLGKECIT